MMVGMELNTNLILRVNEEEEIGQSDKDDDKTEEQPVY